MSGARLRPWRASDADVVWGTILADAQVARQFPESQGPDRIAEYLLAPGRDDRVGFAIVDAHDAVVGGVAAQVNHRMRSAWVSYWLTAPARGSGLATRALLGLCAWLVARGTHRLELGHRLNNPASQRVAERAGFVREGVLREELEYDGFRYDTALMSRLPSDPVPDTEPLPGLD